MFPLDLYENQLCGTISSIHSHRSQVLTFHFSTSSMPKFIKFKGSQDPVSAIHCFANIRWTEGSLAVLLVIPFHQKRLHDNTPYSPKAKEVWNANRIHLLGLPPNPNVMLHIDTFGNRWIVCSSHIKETLLVPKNRRQTHCKSIDLSCVSLPFGSPTLEQVPKIQRTLSQWVEFPGCNTRPFDILVNFSSDEISM